MKIYTALPLDGGSQSHHIIIHSGNPLYGKRENIEACGKLKASNNGRRAAQWWSTCVIHTKARGWSVALGQGERTQKQNPASLLIC